MQSGWLFRHSPRAVALLLLLWLAWQALAGGLRQMPRARTPGQKIETVVQLQFGFLSLLVAFSGGWRTIRCGRWAAPLRSAWSLSFAASAGFSALVWGPPMPPVAALFAAAALLLARGLLWVIFHSDGENSFAFPSSVV